MRALAPILRTAFLASGVLLTPLALAAQAKKAPLAAPSSASSAPNAPARSATRAVASAKIVRNVSPTARLGGAWLLPEADALVQKVFTRIVNSDRPGAVPIREYQRRFVGREATLEAVRRFTGRGNEVSPAAFAAVSDGWTNAPALVPPSCEGTECPAPENSLWLAITRIERGEVPSEVFVWYTTNFDAHSPSGPQKAAYAFCERWVRVSSGWKYEGFVRVKSGGEIGLQ